LTDPDKRKITIDQIIARIRRKTANIPGARLFMQAVQDIKIGGRNSNAQYQFTLQSQDLKLLNVWAPKVMDRLKMIKKIADLNTDQQNSGMQVSVNIDGHRLAPGADGPEYRRRALRCLRPARGLDDVHRAQPILRVMEVAPQYWQNPDTLKTLFAKTTSGKACLWPPSCASLFKHSISGQPPRAIPSVTLSFNLPPGVALGKRST